MVEKKTAQALIARLPYAASYDANEIYKFALQVDSRGLICLSIPIHVESPNNGGKLIYELEQLGLFTIAKCAWYRDRHIVTTKSRRLTNTWEPIAILSRSKNYLLDRQAPSKLKKGYETKTDGFDEEEFLTCIGDHWPIRNDRRDRRFLPETVVINCAQLAGLGEGDIILDPYGNPGVQEACENLNWEYRDGGAPSEIRLKKTPQRSVRAKSV